MSTTELEVSEFCVRYCTLRLPIQRCYQNVQEGSCGITLLVVNRR